MRCRPHYNRGPVLTEAIPAMTLPTWLTLLRATRERNLAIEGGKRRKAVPRRLSLERLEDRPLPPSITILGGDLITAGGRLEQYGVGGLLSQGTGNRSVNLDPGTYNVQDGNGDVYGTFTVSNQGTVAGTTGALTASGS